MSMDILIVAYHVREALAECLASIAKFSMLGYRLTVYENGQHNYPLTWLWNRFIEKSNREFVVMMNPDILVGPGWDTETIACMREYPDCATASPITNSPPNREALPHVIPDNASIGDLEPLTAKLKELFKDQRFYMSQDHRMTSGHCLVIRREAWIKVNGFDENFPFAGNDYDFTRRLVETGMQVGVCTHAMTHHKWNLCMNEARRLGAFDNARHVPRFSQPPPGVGWDSI